VKELALCQASGTDTLLLPFLVSRIAILDAIIDKRSASRLRSA